MNEQKSIAPVRCSAWLGRFIDEDGQWATLTKNRHGEFVVTSLSGERTLKNPIHKRRLDKLHLFFWLIALKHILVSFFAITLRRNLNRVSIGKKYRECFHKRSDRPNEKS
jgi:hypothetical protein